MISVSFSQQCNAPLELAWDYVSDYRNVTEYIDGVSVFEATGAQTTGVGAEFKAELGWGRLAFSTVFVATEWVEQQVGAFSSTKALRTSTAFHFIPVSDDVTTVELRQDMSVGGGLTGRTTERLLEPLLRASIYRTAGRIARNVERRYRDQRRAG